jgi:hypothetical protein
MSSVNDMTTIIAADYMYLIILGEEKIIKKIVDKLNKQSEDNKQKTQYTMCKIDKPCAELLDDDYIQSILINEAKDIVSINNDDKQIIDSDIDRYKKYIVFDEGIETAQCLTYADILSTEISYYKNNNKENNSMLMELIDTNTYYKISYPILQLGEEVNPDDLISAWIINNDIVSLAKDLTIKPVNIVGTEHDILVFAAYINS